MIVVEFAEKLKRFMTEGENQAGAITGVFPTCSNIKKAHRATLWSTPKVIGDDEDREV